MQPLPPLRDVIAKYGLRTKKSLGQHFLLDGNLTDAIARQAGDLSGHTVIEIGPGPGGLTRSLLTTGAREIIILEKDARCLPALEELHPYANGRLRVIEGDATDQDLTALGSAPRAIIANLPYNVGTEMLINWLDTIYHQPDAFRVLVLMFQKEVAERIAAAPGTREYGRLSVLAQWLCEVRVVRLVPAAAFTPPPKVDSAVIQLVPRAAPLGAVNKKSLERVVAIAFQQRRKMLRSALKPLGPELIAALPELGIDPTTRPDQLELADYVKLAQRFNA